LSFELSAKPILSFSILSFELLNHNSKLNNSKSPTATIQNSKFKTQNSKLFCTFVDFLLKVPETSKVSTYIQHN